MTRIIWLLIRITPIYWAGFLLAMGRHAWRMHRDIVVACTTIVVCLCTLYGGIKIGRYTFDALVGSEDEVGQVDPVPGAIIWDTDSLQAYVMTLDGPVLIGQTMHLGMFVPDGTYCQHDSLPTLPISITCEDFYGSSIQAWTDVPHEWDGKTLKVSATVLANSPSPSGQIRIDWTGVCADGDTIIPPKWPSYTIAGGQMRIDLSPVSEGEIIKARTYGDILLENCKPGGDQRLYLRGEIDERETYTARLKDYHFTQFELTYRTPVMPQTSEADESEDDTVMSGNTFVGNAAVFCGNDGACVKMYESQDGMVVKTLPPNANMMISNMHQ